MPFDPHKVAFELGLKAPSAGSAETFDPHAVAQSLGIQTLPNQGNIQDGASTADSLASQVAPAVDTYNKYSQNAGQGFGLGFGSQINAGIQSRMGAVDQAITGSNNFGDKSAPDASLVTRTLDAISNMDSNYTRAKKGVDEKIDQTRASDPIKAGLVEMASAIAPTFVAGALTGLAGLGSIAQAGAIGSLYSFGSSKKEGLDRVGDAATGGLLAAGTAGALSLAGKAVSSVKNADFGKYLESEYGDYSKPIKAIQDLKASATKADPYALNYKTSLGEPFRVGAEMGKALSDPNVQTQVAHEWNAQPKILQDIIDNTKSNIGTLKDSLKNSHGSAEVDAHPVFKNIYDFIDNIKTGKSDVDRIAAKADLKSSIAALEDSLGQGRDPITNKLPNTNLGNLIDAQSSLGKDVFENKIFNKDSVINGAAKKVWGMLADSVNKADETVGSGGQISTINKVYSALYDMEENMINGTTIKALTDPQAAGAENKYTELVKPFQDLPPNVRDILAPELHDYLANQFPKVFSKAKVMLLATDRGAQASQANKSILSLSGLRGLKQALSANVMNRAGALSSGMSAGGALNSLQSGLQNPTLNGSLQSIAPSIGAQQSNGSLNQLK